MHEKGFRSLITAPSAFFRCDDEGESLVTTHVDDCTSSCISAPPHLKNHETDRLKDELGRDFKFKTRDLTTTAKVLGWTVTHDEDAGTIKIAIGMRVRDMLERYGMADANPITTPMDVNALALFYADEIPVPDEQKWLYANLVGELLWISTTVRPDVAFAVHVLSRFLRFAGLERKYDFGFLG